MVESHGISTKPAEVENETVRGEILRLRRQGYVYREIAERVGRSIGSVHRTVQRAMAEAKRENREEADDLADAQIERLQAILTKLWPLAYPESGNPDMDAVDRVLKIEQRIAALRGLDAPARTINDHNVTGRHLIIATDEPGDPADHAGGGMEHDPGPAQP
jgi:DNA-binding CsgD family transcriptional regulator